MIENAIVFVSGMAEHASLRVGGLGLLERSLLAAARAGVRRCFVVGANRTPRLGRRCSAEVVALPREAEAAVGVLHAAGMTPDDPVLCIHATAVFQPRVLTALVAAYGYPGAPAVVARVNGAGTTDLLPLATFPLRTLPKLWAALVTGDHAAWQRVCSEGVTACRVGGDIVNQVRRFTQVGTVERALLLALENPGDGRIDRLINRKLSRPISRVLLRWPLHPNHVTLLSFLVGLLSAVGFAQGTYLAALGGALLLQFAAVLDCCDGEIARVKFQESRLGHSLDVSLDALANAVIFAGIARGTAVTHELSHAFALGTAAFFGILGSFIVVTYAETRLPEHPAVPEHRLVAQLVHAVTTRDFSVIVLAAALAGALPWFLWGAAVGANIFWLLLLGLLVRGAAPRQIRD